ncbi:MAG: complex I subunit 4 family protein [Candidatus Dormibacteria bacterium]
MNVPWLTVVLLLPAGAALLLQLVPRSLTAAIKGLTVAATLSAGVIVALLVAHLSSGPVLLQRSTLPMHFDEILVWFRAGPFAATYHVGLDGVSAVFLALNAGLFLLASVLVARRDTPRLKLFCGLLLLTETMTAGVILSVDTLLFYVFWEAMLIPLYFLLTNYGGHNRGRATLKFVVYTVAGSLPMLVALLAVVFVNRRGFDLTSIVGGGSMLGTQPLVIPGINVSTVSPEQLAFLGFVLAFAVKLPIVPFHTWLPDLYESAPAPALAFFAGIVSKLGAFGFIRYCITIFPDMMNQFRYVLAGLAVLSIVYGALLALSQTDIKRIVAYSSISHLGFIALGIFTLTGNGLDGALLQVVNHGIIIAALFIVAHVIEERTGTRDLRELGGLNRRMPWFYGFFVIITLAGLGMPGMNSFAGEFTIMLGAFQLNPAYAVLAGVGVTLAAWYMLRFHQGAMHEPAQSATENARDIRLGQGLVLLPLAALMILIGVFPRPVGDIGKQSATYYVSITQSLGNSTPALPAPIASAATGSTP